jgi:1-acyl-sn-glycerol-3-phosphate acyltransferase
MASFMEDVRQPSGTLRLWATGGTILLVALFALPLQILSLKLKLRTARWIPLVFHRAVARIMGLRVHLVARPSADRPMLILSNHVSWIDIVALGSVMPLSFVAKAEIAEWPVFGLMAKLQRSVFVDRSRRNDTGKVNAEIADRLTEGDPIVLFAESTTSDGNRILPFRSALVGAAQETILSGGVGKHVCLQPVSLAYTTRDGLPTGRMGRAHIGWYGDMAMLPHLAGILRGGPLDVEVHFGKPLAFDAGSDRKSVTRVAENEVRRLMAEALTGRKDRSMPAPAPPDS